MLLQSQPWPKLNERELNRKVFIVPLGSMEQHGHHLPVFTDTLLVEAIASGVHDKLAEDVVLLPTLWCGHSTHHLAYPGTVSVSQSVYQALISDICDSLIKTGAKKILLLNGHGGNDVPVRYSLREIKSRNKAAPEAKVVFASYWALAAESLRRVRESEIGGMGHACEMETSLMLFLHEALVDMEKALRDGPQQKPPYRVVDMQQGTPFYMVEEFDEISNTGTVGHADLATAEKGRRFYEGIVSEVAAFVADLKTW